VIDNSSSLEDTAEQVLRRLQQILASLS